MPQATFSVRMDDKLKREFDKLCADFGMNATTAFNVFAKAVVRERIQCDSRQICQRTSV